MKKKQPKKRKYTERGATIGVPNDNFLDLLESAFRFQSPNTSNDKEILKSVSHRLRQDLGKDGDPDLEKALQLIETVQSKLLKCDRKDQTKITANAASLALNMNRIVLGLVAFSATDRDLAKLYRSLQGVHPKQAQVSALIRFGDDLQKNVLWGHDKFSLDWHEKVVQSDPRLVLSPIYSNEIKKVVKILKSASDENWDSDSIKGYGSSGRVARVYFNRCFWLLQKIIEDLDFHSTELHDLYKYLGANRPTLREGAKFKINPKREIGSPITQYLQLKLAKTVADIFKP